MSGCDPMQHGKWPYNAVALPTAIYSSSLKPSNTDKMETTEKPKIIDYPSENVLDDDYPVHWDYAYLGDGKPRLSPLGGGATVRDLKREWKCSEIRSCNLAGRGFLG
jgi:hypothetical protein